MRQLGIKRLFALCASMALVGAGFLFSASVASADAPRLLPLLQVPDTAQPDTDMLVKVAVENSGDAPMSGTLTITNSFPAGISYMKSAIQEAPPGAECEGSGQTVTCDVPAATLYPGMQVEIWIYGVVQPGAEGELSNLVTVSGGGTGQELVRNDTISIGAGSPFAIKEFSVDAHEADGSAALQAGSSPAYLRHDFGLPFYNVPLVPGFPNLYSLVVHPPEQTRTVVAHLPPGLVANPLAIPRCTGAQLLGGQMPSCPRGSQVGTARVLTTNISALYNMVPPRGVPASFAFLYARVPIVLDAHIRPDGGFDIVVRNVSTTIPFLDSHATLWGVPADPSHDTARSCHDDGYGGGGGPVCPAEAPRKAFLRMPTSCAASPLKWGLEVDSYQHPGAFIGAETTSPSLSDCDQVPFDPSFSVRPTTEEGDSPSGLEVDLHLPQNDEPDSPAQAHLKDVTLTLPPGMTVNPASADGLAACTPTQIGLVSAVGETPVRFDGSQPTCPDASKLGSVLVETPAIDHPLPGNVYLASQDQNPFGSMLALYIVIDDEASGIRVKLGARINPDPQSGQLTTTVTENPQLPFEDLALRLYGGPHGPLQTPIGCGAYTINTNLTPWSSPQGKDAARSSSFQVARGAAGSGCVASEGQAPKDPKFSAGTFSPLAGAYTPFVANLSRADGTQRLTGLDLTLPKGLLARVAGIATCSEAALAKAASRSGAEEKASASCPGNSELGSVAVGAGAGPTPVSVSGKLYFAGPYKGAPYSLAVVTPAVAGPFDLGTVVVRTALRIDPETTQVRAVSDPIPAFLRGIPLGLRSISIRVQRPNYTLNPTSCDPASVDARVATLTGQSALLSNRFQVGSCARLGFKPRLSLSLKGPTHRNSHPKLRAVLSARPGDANIGHAVVTMPKTELLENAHIKTICTRVQYAAEKCPKGSVYGYAKAISPLLDYPLYGPVYLRSSDNPLPDLVASLDGQIHVDIVGRIDAVNARLRSTFATIPDAPVSKFVLTMKGGKQGLLVNNTELCKTTPRATVRFDGQNGKVHDAYPVMKADCKKK
jgi:hypothetical protein